MEVQRLDHEILQLQQELTLSPPGKLMIARNQSHDKWYVRLNDTTTYLPKSQRQIAEPLAYKKYLTLQLDYLTQERRALQFYLKHHPDIAKHTEQLFHLPSFQKLLSPYLTPLSDELSTWKQSSFESNSSHPENLIYSSLSGNTLRSKSESLIDMVLFMNQIPFRYECVLQLGDTRIYPDFTIRHPSTGETICWEHFGMMDHSDYARNAYAKLQLYTTFQIVPSINLITTFETKSHPLSSDFVEKLVQCYFL